MSILKKGHGVFAVGMAGGTSTTSLVILADATASRPRVAYCGLQESVSDQLVSFLRGQNIRKARLVDVLLPGSYNLLQVDVQGSTQEERREAARWQVRELLNYPAEEAVIDLINIPQLGSEESFKTYAVVAPQSNLKQRVHFCQQTELSLSAIDITELALRNLLELFEDEPHGHCLLWMREEDSLLVISRGESFFFSRAINVGVSHLEEVGQSASAESISEFVQTQLDSIVLEIQRSVDYCESNFRLPPVRKIQVATCGSESPSALDYLDRYLQADVVSADFRQVLDLPLDVDPPTIHQCLPAIGAALRAGGRG